MRLVVILTLCGALGCGAPRYKSAGGAHVQTIPVPMATRNEGLTARDAPARELALADEAGDSDGEDTTAGPAPAAVAATSPGVTPSPEKIVVTGSLRVTVKDGAKAITEVREWVISAGGRVSEESQYGGASSWNGSMQLRLPPDKLTGLFGVLDDLGTIEQRSLSGTDVSKQWFDQELALRGLRITLGRLEELAKKEQIGLADVLALEKEMARVRGDIERIEGEHQFLADRIQYASVAVSFGVDGPVVFAPHAKFHPGPRASFLYLPDAGMLEDQRFGGGVSIRLDTFVSLDLDVFPSETGEGRAILTSMGHSEYSDFLGGGRRAFLNPFIGIRAGYAWIHDRNHLLVAGEVGLELFKSEWVLIDVSERVLGLINDDGGELALQTSGGLTIPF